MVWLVMAMAWSRWQRPRHPRWRTLNVTTCWALLRPFSRETTPLRPRTPPSPTWPLMTVLWMGNGRRCCAGRSLRVRSLYVLPLRKMNPCVRGGGPPNRQRRCSEFRNMYPVDGRRRPPPELAGHIHFMKNMTWLFWFLCFRFDALTELGASTRMRTECLCISVLRVASGPRMKLASCISALNPRWFILLTVLRRWPRC